jgi:hypothetical protein
MQQVDFVDNEQPYNANEVVDFARQDVPFLRCGYEYLGVLDLLFGEVSVTCEFGHLDAETLKPFLEAQNHLVHQSLHWRDVHDLEFGQIDFTRPKMRDEIRLTRGCSCR